ncbi:MAG TPA: acyltransferase family protein [Candidatus Limnocylindrales bacterium]|nr:acyltransferase family protein [Candidatus Limnocylindrales bacterium]
MVKEGGFYDSVDLIRTVAIVGVIMLHASNDYTVQSMGLFEIIRWNTVSFYETAGRLGVPLFLLLTGALLLQPSKSSEPIREFFKKRWTRIGLPFIFWGAVYFVWDFLVVHQINGLPITSTSIIQGFLTGPYYQFWYLYLLVGLYLLTPILRVLITRMERDLIKYLLVLWLLGAFLLPALYQVTSLRLDSNVLEFTSYAGYFILGAFLVTVQVRRSRLAILTALGIALTMVATYAIAATVGGVEMYYFQQYFSPTLILASAALFMLLIDVAKPSVQSHMIRAATPVPSSLASTLNLVNETGKQHNVELPKQSAGRRLLTLISANTLPIFLFHVMVLETIQKGYLGFVINGNTLNSVVEIPLNTVITLFVSLGIILALKKVPHMKRLIG